MAFVARACGPRGAARRRAGGDARLRPAHGVGRGALPQVEPGRGRHRRQRRGLRQPGTRSRASPRLPQVAASHRGMLLDATVHSRSGADVSTWVKVEVNPGSRGDEAIDRPRLLAGRRPRSRPPRRGGRRPLGARTARRRARREGPDPYPGGQARPSRLDRHHPDRRRSCGPAVTGIHHVRHGDAGVLPAVRRTSDGAGRTAQRGEVRCAGDRATYPPSSVRSSGSHRVATSSSPPRTWRRPSSRAASTCWPRRSASSLHSAPWPSCCCSRRPSRGR